MSWFSENFVDPLENVGKALVTGDIMGGKDQASGSDWLKSILDVGAIATAGIGGAGLAGIGPAAGLLGGGAVGAGGVAEAATPTALGFAGDVSADAGGLSSFLADPAAAAGAGDVTADTSALGLTDPAAGGVAGNTIPGVPSWLSAPTTSFPTPDLGAAPAATSDLTSITGGAPIDAGITTGPAAGGPAAGNSLWSSLVGGVTKNPLGTAAAAGGLGLAFLNRNKTDPNQAQVQALAQPLLGQAQGFIGAGQQLQSYLINGTLPPGLQAQVTQQVQAAKARIVQGYASRGQPADPTKNSALAQELNNVDLQALALAGDLESKLAAQGKALIDTGLNETGLSMGMYQWLTSQGKADTNQLMTAIANFAAALGGGSKSITLKTA